MELAIPKFSRELGRVSNFNQSINCHHHMKDHVEIGHLAKHDALRMNRDQVMDLEIWFKIHTNVPNRLKGTGQQVCLNIVKKRSIVCDCIHEEKINFFGSTQNDCYGNQLQPLEILFESCDANNSCSFIKQDLIFKQAYLVSLCFVLFGKLNF